MRSRPRTHALALPAAVALVSLAGGCAVPFPDYDPATGGASATGSVGGAGGSAADTTSASESSSSAMLADNGQPCDLPEACASGHCVPDVSGARICCAQACDAEAPETCGTTGQCLDGTECVRFPDGIECDPLKVCDGATSSSFRCLSGTCEQFDAPCANGLTCSSDGMTCKSTCSTASDCAEIGADCVSGICQKPAGELCNTNAECISGFCGSTGVGRCCAAECVAGSDECGFDCDATGACVVAPNTQVCSVGSTCVGDAQVKAKFCDGAGTCGATLETKPCPGNLACAGGDCFGSCDSNDAAGDLRCAEGFWCNEPLFKPGTFVCAAKLGVLGPCNRDSQCISGKCNPLPPTTIYVCAP